MAFRNLLLTCAALTSLTAIPAMAQPLMNNDETIVVVPPRVLQQEPLRHGMKATRVAIHRQVGIGDLDLSQAADRRTLRERIHGTALDACRELDAKYPPTVYVPLDPQQDCVRDASRGALAMVAMADED